MANLLIVLDNLKEFVEKALNVLADESDPLNKHLVLIIEQALDKYETGLFHKYTKLRGPEIEQVIKELKTGKTDSYFRLKQLKSLIEHGGWNKDSSFNYFLMVELVKAVPGYELPTAKSLETIVDRFKTLLAEEMDRFIKQYERNQILVQNQIKERQLLLQKEQKSLDFILIANNLDAAKSSAIEQKDKRQFCIYLKGEKVQLAWVDRTGTVYRLDPTTEMLSLLNNQTNQVYQNRLKKECSKALDQFLKKTQLLVNPQDNASLIKSGVSSTFVLRGEPTAYSLYWINAMSQENEIKLNDYPQFLQWLNRVNPITEEHFPEIKMHLLHVKVVKGNEDLKVALSNCLMNKYSIKPKPEVNTKPLQIDKNAFAHLERCLGTHAEKAKSKQDSLPDTHSVKPSPGKLNIDNSAMARLLGHKPKADAAVVESESVVSNCL